MLITVKKGRQAFLSLILCITVLGQASLPAAQANDRAADIIGSRPLMAGDIITSKGLTGSGQMVGIADSGLDTGSMSDIHPDLATANGPSGIPKVMLQSYTNRTVPDDPDGHGTFMAATIAGTGAASQGKYQGIAPGASLYFQALLDENHEIRVPADIADLFLPAYEAGVRVHVNGWGNGGNSYQGNAVHIDKFTYTHPEFLPIFGAGNSGPGRGTITSQANSKNALVVGASQVPRPAFGTEARFADQVASFSSQGPSGDGRIKPDLLAPGSALISACSKLADSNYTAEPAYTRMGGTSMAAAVTGGALALLREQLVLQYGLTNPSSALLKALLINGARIHSGEPGREGFGILDLAGTSLALKTGDLGLADNRDRLRQGEDDEYKLSVRDPTMPIRVTLAWTDPPGAGDSAKALVNDLDLYVTDSSGNRYYGNDIGGRGMADSSNNIERVVIPVPRTGEYTVTVKANRISSGAGQAYALVYGQIYKTGTIAHTRGNQVTLAEGNTLELDGGGVNLVVDGVLMERGPLSAGSDIYYRAGRAYVFARSWHSGGVQAINTPQGDLVVEMNKSVREGGYYLDPRTAGKDGSITVNGRPVAGIGEIPPGAEIKAAVNPVLQTLWSLEAYQKEVSGYIQTVDTVNRQLTILNKDQVYRLARWAAISYRDRIVDMTAQDSPYNTTDRSIFDNLLPGSQVTMKVSPATGMVQSLFVQRPMVIGKVAGLDTVNNRITMDTGKTYGLFPGSIIYKDQKPAGLGDLQAGDRLKAQLMINDPVMIHVEAYSDTSYGRIIYTNAGKKSLYMLDAQNCSRSYTLSERTDIFEMGIAVEPSAILPGSWVRIVGDPKSEEAWRIDIADIDEEAARVLLSVDPVGKWLLMADGTRYHYEAFTRITKGGYIMSVDDLVPGDGLQLTTLLAPSPWTTVLAGAEVGLTPSAPPPDTIITARKLNGVLIIQGHTAADRLYIYRNDGSRELVSAAAGDFNRIFNLLDKETEITAVALDRSTGAMKDTVVKIVDYPVGLPIPVYTDISGHWAEGFITRLTGRGVFRGYEDGSFRPDNDISRAELMVMMAQFRQLPPGGEEDNRFADGEDIPWWAAVQVQAALKNAWVTGYPDGTFRPHEAVTRRQLAQIMANLQDTPLVNIFPGETLQPNRLVTRAEVAAVLARL